MEWSRFLVSFALLMALPLAAQCQTNYATPYTLATLAGGQDGFANGTGSDAEFSSPQGAAVDGAGNVYVGDSGNKAIRKVTPTGVVTKVVRGGMLVSPYGVAVDGATNIYVADYGGGAIRKVTPVGTNWEVSTLAGGFGAPYGVALDSATNLYVADAATSLISKVTQVGTNWVVSTIAGPAGFDHPCGVAVDSATNVYVAGGSNNTIQRLTPVANHWVVTTLAGLAGTVGTNDGIGANARFDFPAGVAVDSATNLYIADQSNCTIRRITLVGTNWTVTTLAGLAGTVGTNDGTGANAQFDSPTAVAIDKAGDLYAADSQNNTIRRGFPASGSPVILTYGSSLSFSNGLFGFDVAGAAGQPVVVDVSTNLVNWLAIWTNTVGPGVLPFSDAESQTSNRFYRAHLPYPRRPLGVYAKVDPSDVIQSKTNKTWGPYFDCLYSQLVSNPAISGLTLQIHWDLVNPESGVYNWSYVTNAFNQVSNWNAMNPGTQKNIQFIVTPGFNSPSWVLTNILNADGSCDPLFGVTGCSTCTNCGIVTFVGYNENADGNLLPLPWNLTYKVAWSNFLYVLNQQFGNNPELVSVSIAGPTGGSDEMILPNDENTCPCHAVIPNTCGNICPTNAAAEPQPNGLMPSAMWNELIEKHYGLSYTNSNQPFIEEWEKAIDLYDGIFHNLTLVVIPGDGEGFPFATNAPNTNPLCQYSPDSSCTAIACILSYFENKRSINGNGKASQVSGLRGSGITLTNRDADLGGVKLLSAQSQALDTWDQIIGGAQFDHAFSACFPGTNCAPEQDEFNVLATFFNGTQAVGGTTNFAGLFSQVSGEDTVNAPLTNSAPLNYLQVYYQDVLYAGTNGCTTIDNGAGGKKGQITVSAQDLLNQASQLLFTIGETPYPAATVPAYPPVCSPLYPPACEPP